MSSLRPCVIEARLAGKVAARGPPRAAPKLGGAGAAWCNDERALPEATTPTSTNECFSLSPHHHQNSFTLTHSRIANVAPSAHTPSTNICRPQGASTCSRQRHAQPEPSQHQAKLLKSTFSQALIEPFTNSRSHRLTSQRVSAEQDAKQHTTRRCYHCQLASGSVQGAKALKSRVCQIDAARTV